LFYENNHARMFPNGIKNVYHNFFLRKLCNIQPNMHLKMFDFFFLMLTLLMI